MVPPHFSPEALLMLQIFLELSSLRLEASRAQDFSKMASLSPMMVWPPFPFPSMYSSVLSPSWSGWGCVTLGKLLASLCSCLVGN